MPLERSVRPLAQRIRCTRHDRLSLPRRSFTTPVSLHEETTTSSTSPPTESEPPHIESQPGPTESTLPSAEAAKPPPWKGRPPLSRDLVHTPSSERKLLEKHNKYPIGSRRRRAALASSHLRIPFSQLPYQCFQEARKILKEDRKEKVDEITRQRERIERLRAVGGADEGGEVEERQREHRLKSMRRRLDELKIWADINDPLVKKRFEDKDGDMTKPIYRHLADLQWRNYKRKVLMQRISQMNVIPDVLPHIDPTVSTALSFPYDTIRIKNVAHGDFVPSIISSSPPRLEIQPFDAGERLISIAVINPDVPDVSKDGFDYRCHFLASNISISPTKTSVDLGKLNAKSQVLIPWLPPYAQKGLRYQRMSIFILQQPAPGESVHSSQTVLDVPKAQKSERYTKREGFVLRSFVNKFNLHPIGVDLFRTQWDEGTTEVMRQAGVVGWDVEFKRMRVEPLPYKRLKSERYR